MIFKGKPKKVNSPKRGQKKGHVGVSRSRPKEEFIQEEIDVKLSHCPRYGEGLAGCRRSYERRIEAITTNHASLGSNVRSRPEICSNKNNFY